MYLSYSFALNYWVEDVENINVFLCGANKQIKEI